MHVALLILTQFKFKMATMYGDSDISELSFTFQKPTEAEREKEKVKSLH